MFMGTMYTPSLSAGFFKKLAGKVKTAAQQVKKVTKVYKKGQAFYKQLTNPDGSVQEVQISPAEAQSIVQSAPPPAAGMPKWIVPAAVAAIALTAFGIFKRKKA